MGADLDGTVVRWSAGAGRLFGWTADEALGRHVSMLVPADDDGSGAEHVGRLVRGEPCEPFEVACATKDGGTVEVAVHVVPVHDDAGRLVGTVALHRDLRPERRAQRGVQTQTEELIARFLDSPLAQARLDLQGRVVGANPALQRLTGTLGQDLVGRPVELLVGPGERCDSAPTEGGDLRSAIERLAGEQLHHARVEHLLAGSDGSGVPAVLTLSQGRGLSGERLLVMTVEDVSALRAAEQAARTQAARFDAVLQSMPVAVFTYDLHGICTMSRGLALRHLGLADDELVGTSLFEMYAGEPDVRSVLEACLDGTSGRTRNEVAGRSWEGHHRPLRDASGAVVGGLGVALDVTDLMSAQQEVRANEARMTALFAQSSDIVLVVDADGRVLWGSPGISRVMGYDERGVLWQRAIDFDHPEDRPLVEQAWQQAVSEPGGSAVVTCRVRHADGTWRWCEHVLTNRFDDPAVAGMVINLRDITESREASQELQRLALHDALTGLANRALLLDRVQHAMTLEARSERRTGLVLMDVVSLGQVNERLGHRAGDQVLSGVAERLRAAVRTTDSVARVGGDEFAVLVGDVASAEELRSRAAAVVDDVNGVLSVDGHSVEIELRAGIALTPAPHPGALLAAAERALLAGGDDGRAARVVLAPGAVDSSAEETCDATEDLRRGIEQGELRLHFQPVVGLDDDSIPGVEALVRWAHPERGLLAPSAFIPLAESSGLVVPLGEWVLREAVARAAAWQSAGRPLQVGVNLSPHQLVGTRFVELVRDLLASSGLRPDLLVIEVTESSLMDDPGAPGVLRAVRDLGVLLALDDFGTGYSSLTYLKRIPVDVIKIDRSFVAGLGRDADDEAIVASVVSLARAVGKLVVAEGVETVGQLQALRALGVDQAQGFLWSAALAPAALADWLVDRPRRPVAPPPPPAPVGVPARPPAVLRAGEADERRILQLHAEGASLNTIAAALNAEGRRTPAGPRWTTTTVARVVAATAQRV